jgi:hypothetical protein
MDTDNQPQANLELGTEANPPMTQNAADAAPSKIESPADFFNRVLSDGQTEQTAGAESPESPEAHAPEADTEANEAEATNSNDDRPTKGVQKRIDKLSALRREAEEKAQKLENELAELKRQKAAPISTPNNPYGHLEDRASIEAEYEKMRNVRLFCERFPDGYYPEDGGQPISKDRITETKVNAIRAIEEFLPRQAEYLESREVVKNETRKEFSWLNDPTDERTVKVNRFIQAVPEIKRYPDYEMYAAHMVNGMTSYKAQKANAQKGVQRAPIQPIMGSSPAPSAQKADPVQGAMSMERYRKTGSIDDLANVFKSKFV